jgi:hypothetical protein
VQAQKRNPSVRSIQRVLHACTALVPFRVIALLREGSTRTVWCGNKGSSKRPAAAAPFKPPQTLRSPVLAWRSVARAMPTEARACVAGA